MKGGCGDPNYVPKAKGGFKRGTSNLQGWVSEGGDFAPELGRYHLFVNFACGWSHRVMLVRSLKGLEDCVSLSHTGLHFVHDAAGRYLGWPLPDDPTGNGFKTSFDVYNSSNAEYGDGSESHGKRQLGVPILFDKRTRRVVSSDSAQICVMLTPASAAYLVRTRTYNVLWAALDCGWAAGALSGPRGRTGP